MLPRDAELLATVLPNCIASVENVHSPKHAGLSLALRKGPTLADMDQLKFEVAGR
jgi:hypothetical protein